MRSLPLRIFAPQFLELWVCTLCIAIALSSPLAAQETGAPTVSLSAGATSVTENTESTVSLEVSSSVPFPNGQVFGLQLQGTGIDQQDFVDPPATIEIPPGQSKGTVLVRLQDDSLIEGIETVTASLVQVPDNIILSPGSQATFDVIDNDFATIQLSATQSTGTEGGTSQIFEVELDTGGSQLQKELTIDLTLPPSNTAIGLIAPPDAPPVPGARDFLVLTGQIVFPAGSANGEKRVIEISLLADNLIEGEEAATISFSSASDTAVSNLDKSHVLKLNDGNAPSFEFSSAETNLEEGGNAGSIGIQLNIGSAQLVTALSLDLIGSESDSAIGNFLTPQALATDYTLSPSSIAFTAGTKNGTVINVSAEALTDQLIEGEESASLRLQLRTPGFPQFDPPQPHTIKVQDGNQASVQFVSSTSNVAEGDDPITISAILDIGNASLETRIIVGIFDKSIGQAIGRFGQFSAEGADPEDPTASYDFELLINQIEFAPGTSNEATQSLSISPLQDQLVEGTEFATLELRTISGPVVIGNQAQHQYIIGDANSAQVVFATPDLTLAEGVADQSITVTLQTGEAILAVPVELQITDIGDSTAIGDIQSSYPDELTALADGVETDYEILDASISFPIGARDQDSESILVSTLTDLLIEGEEIGNLGFGEISGPVTAGEANQFTLKISDSNQGIIAFRDASSNVREGEETSLEVSFQINTSGATLAKNFVFPFNVEDQSASRETDFELPANLQLNWPQDAEDGDTRSIIFPIRNDSILEATETFSIQLQNPPAPFSIASNEAHPATIEDDDSALVGLVPLSESPQEGGDPILVGVDLSSPSDTDTIVKLEISGSALSNPQEENWRIEAGSTRSIVQIGLNDDDFVEATETVRVRIVSIESGDADIQIDSENQEKVFNVADNDTTIISLASTSDAAEDEQAGQLSIQLTKGIEAPIKLLLAFSGSATLGTDYTSPFTQITLPSFASTFEFELPVIEDNLAEGQETIIVSISGVDLPDLPITIQEETLEISIIDNDAKPIGTPDNGPAFTINEDSTLNLGQQVGVLANDTDEDDGNGPANLTASLAGPEPNNATQFTFGSDGSLLFQPTPNFNGVETFEYIASDGTNQSAPTLVTLTVTAVNDPPVQTVPGTQTVVEGGELQFNTTNENLIRIADVDAGEASLGVTLSARGTLSLGSTDGLEITNGDGVDDSTISFEAHLADINRALDGLLYRTPTGTDPDTITLTSNDRGSDGAGGPMETQSTIPISIRPLNTPPQLTLPESDPLAVVGSGSPQVVAPGIIVADAENANLQSARIQISSNFQSTEDTLSIPSLPEGISGAFDAETGVLNLTGPSNLASFQEALRQVQFQNTSALPNTDPREVTFSVRDQASQSNFVSRQIEVSVPAFPPSLSIGAQAPRQFTEGGLPISIAGSLTLSEGSAGPITGATVEISSGFAVGEDQLRAGNRNGLSSQFDSQTGVLKISGEASGNTYGSVLRSVVFNNGSDSPSTAQRSISISVQDAERSSNTVSTRVNVAPTNDSPFLSFTPGPAIPFEQGSDPVSIFSSISIRDADHGSLGAATVMFANRFNDEQDELGITSLPSGISSGGFNKTNGSLTLQGNASLSDYATAIEGIVYRNSGDFTSDRSLSVSVAVADPEGSTSNLANQQLRLIGRSTPPEILELRDISFPEDTKSFEIGFVIRDDKTPVGDIAVEVTTEKPEDFFDENGFVLKREGNRFTLQLLPLPNVFGEIPIQVKATDEQNLESKASFLLTITPINDLPIVTAAPLDPLFFYDGSGPRPLFDSFEIKDPDQGKLFGATLSFESGFLPQEDTLSIQPTAPIEATINRGSGEIRLSGKGTADQYAETIMTIEYFNISHLPKETTKRLNLIVFDTEKTRSKTIPLEIRVIDANLPPQGTSDQVSANGEESVTIPFSRLLGNDSDPENDPLVISLVNARTRNGVPILVQSDTIVVKSPEAGTSDSFFYTLSDQSGGYTAVPVTLTP